MGALGGHQCLLHSPPTHPTRPILHGAAAVILPKCPSADALPLLCYHLGILPAAPQCLWNEVRLWLPSASGIKCRGLTVEYKAFQDGSSPPSFQFPRPRCPSLPGFHSPLELLWAVCDSARVRG